MRHAGSGWPRATSTPKSRAARAGRAICAAAAATTRFSIAGDRPATSSAAGSTIAWAPTCASPMSGQTCSTDVVVLGGGPAGAACALRLARLGHRVTLVERAERGRPHVGESLPPTVLPLLQTLGVGERVEAARFLRPRGAIVQWDGVLRDVRDDARDEPGFQVDRGRF